MTLAKYGILIEINSKYSVPSVEFIKLAKRNGDKFVLGSDFHSADELLSLGKNKKILNLYGFFSLIAL